MKSVKVLGSGCKKCHLTVDSISATAKKLGVEIEIEKVEDYAQIASYGVMATPSVVVDGVVVHSGSVPTATMIESWIR
ncbi:MAG: thioredoxin family protein [Polyangiales bacterium]